jgi:hypothetical protein
VPLPPESCIAAVYADVHLADSFSIDLPLGASRSPEVLAKFVLANQPRWIAVLMRIRDTLVGGLGLKTAKRLKFAEGSRIGIFRIYESNAIEVVMGEDDRHLDFRASALYQAPAPTGLGRPRLVLSTVVHCHNIWGRGYIRLIAPFHRLVVQSYLRQAARVGWPTFNEVPPEAFNAVV